MGWRLGRGSVPTLPLRQPAHNDKAKRETDLAGEHVSLHPGEASGKWFEFPLSQSAEDTEIQHLGKGSYLASPSPWPRRCGQRDQNGEQDGRVVEGHRGKNRCVGTSSLEPSPERTACQNSTLGTTKARASHRPTEQFIVERIWATHRANGADQQAAAAEERGGGRDRTAMIEATSPDVAASSVPSPASARVAKGDVRVDRDALVPSWKP